MFILSSHYRFTSLETSADIELCFIITFDVVKGRERKQSIPSIKWHSIADIISTAYYFNIPWRINSYTNLFSHAPRKVRAPLPGNAIKWNKALNTLICRLQFSVREMEIFIEEQSMKKTDWNEWRWRVTSEASASVFFSFYPFLSLRFVHFQISEQKPMTFHSPHHRSEIKNDIGGESNRERRE